MNEPTGLNMFMARLEVAGFEVNLSPPSASISTIIIKQANTEDKYSVSLDFLAHQYGTLAFYHTTPEQALDHMVGLIITMFSTHKKTD